MTKFSLYSLIDVQLKFFFYLQFSSLIVTANVGSSDKNFVISSSFPRNRYSFSSLSHTIPRAPSKMYARWWGYSDRTSRGQNVFQCQHFVPSVTMLTALSSVRSTFRVTLVKHFVKL